MFNSFFNYSYNLRTLIISILIINIFWFHAPLILY